MGDITDFTRRLKIKEVFNDSSYTDISLVKEKSIKPVSTQSIELNQITALIENLEPVNVKNQDNLTQDERTGLQDLKKAVYNYNIVLRSADKGNSIVLLNHDYRWISRYVTAKCKQKH